MKNQKETPKKMLNEETQILALHLEVTKEEFKRKPKNPPNIDLCNV